MADCFKINYDLVYMINCKGEKLRYENFGGSCFSHSDIRSDRLDCMAPWEQDKDIRSKTNDVKLRRSNDKVKKLGVKVLQEGMSSSLLCCMQIEALKSSHI